MLSVSILSLAAAISLSACELPFGREPASAFDQVCVSSIYGDCCKDRNGQVLSGDCPTVDDLEASD